MGAPIHEVEDLGRVEELLELAQKLDALIVPALGVDEGQERAGAGRGAGGLPETCGEPKCVSPQPQLPPPRDTDGGTFGEQRPRGRPDDAVPDPRGAGGTPGRRDSDQGAQWMVRGGKKRKRWQQGGMGIGMGKVSTRADPS